MDDLKLQYSEPIQHQITRMIRDKILRNELLVGVRLPSARELAEQLGTNSFTVHSALVPLVKEGLIERRQRAGTFVRANRPVSSMVIGIYCCRSFWNLRHLGFVRAVQESLRQKLAGSGYRTRLWIDERPEEEQFEPLKELVQAVNENEIQGLAVLIANRRDVRWLKALPVPSAFITSANIPNKIQFDGRQFIRLALDRLIAQGCRTIGLIAGMCPGDSERGWQHPANTFYDDFLELLEERELDYRNSWMRSPREELTNPELFGYVEFQKLWAQSERPDGLVVFPDVVAAGVAKAVVDAGSEAAKLRFAFHRNRGVNLSWPSLAANWISSDVEEVADGLILQITQQADGEESPAVMLSYKISEREELP